MRNTAGLKIAVLDAETDPFKAERVPEPFSCAFYDGSRYIEKWGDDCIPQLLREIIELPDDYLIYVHNGGKFDFWYMMDWMDDKKPLSIINGRLVEFSLMGSRHIFRDSLAIIPIPLKDYQKEKVDYSLFEKDVRDKHRSYISSYLKSDCINLYKITSRFAYRFIDWKGNVPISIGQASIRILMEMHPFQVMTEASDAQIRDWYLGGRVQCFQAGILKGPWKVYDVNSMYSYAMSEYLHPKSDIWDSLDAPPRAKKTIWFAEFEGKNKQALGVKMPNKGIDFSIEKGTFKACSHELIPAIKAGLVTVDRWLTILQPNDCGSFKRYVKHFHGEKIVARAKHNKEDELFAKFMLNTPYGKTGQNPDDFKDYKILRHIMGDRRLREDGFEPDVRISDDPFIEIWSRKCKATGHGYYNVGIAASVCSAARSVLLEGLQLAVDPIYCDTDSVICRDFNGPIDPYILGAWKHEATVDFAAIAGKKMYCLYNIRGGKVEPVKWASKGGDLSPKDIIDIAKGGVVEHTSEVPTYSLSRGVTFTSRKFKRTVENPRSFR